MAIPTSTITVNTVASAINSSPVPDSPPTLPVAPQVSDHHFPDDLANYKYYMSFDFIKYLRRSIFDQPFLKGQGTVRLPIPANLVDSQKADWEPTATNLMQGAGAEMGLRTGSTTKAALGTAGGAIAGSVLRAIASRIPGGSTLAEAAPQVLQMYGVAVNPFLTVLFKSPTFRRHSFAWRLSPNNPKESAIVRNILWKFKYHMLPDLRGGGSGALLGYPDLCIVKIYPNDDYTYKFKPCAIESISINYAPNGNPSFFNETDAPSDIQFTVNLLEVEYWLKENMNPAELLNNAFGSTDLFNRVVK